MSKNFTLYEDNLANTCQNEDCEVLNPRTVADQVYIDENTTLTEWINSLNIPSDVTINPLYDTGVNIGTINSNAFYVPFLTKDGNTEVLGIPKFDWNYFTFDGTNNRVQLDLNWSLNSGTYGENFVTVGNIKNSGNNAVLCDITIPSPSLDYEKSDDSSRLLLKMNLGSQQLNVTAIPYEDIESVAQNCFTPGENITIEDGIINANNTEYTASHGIGLTGNDIRHTNNITAGTVQSTITTDGKLRTPTITYDANGHVVNIGTSDILNISATDYSGAWESKSLSVNYFRIPSAWLTGAGSNSNDAYIPLFKIYNEGPYDDFKVNHLFEIVSRLSYVYYGKYLIIYGNRTQQGRSLYEKNILTVNRVPSTSILNVVAYLNTETDSSGNIKDVITVYRKYTAPLTKDEDTFLVSILGQNNSHTNVVNLQNSYINYTTQDGSPYKIGQDSVQLLSDTTILGTLITAMS